MLELLDLELLNTASRALSEQSKPSLDPRSVLVRRSAAITRKIPLPLHRQRLHRLFYQCNLRGQFHFDPLIQYRP